MRTSEDPPRYVHVEHLHPLSVHQLNKELRSMILHTRLAALGLAITAIMIAHITVDPRARPPRVLSSRSKVIGSRPTLMMSGA